MTLSPICTLELGLIVLPKNPESFSEPVWMYRSLAVLLVKRTLCRESAIARVRQFGFMAMGRVQGLGSFTQNSLTKWFLLFILLDPSSYGHDPCIKSVVYASANRPQKQGSRKVRSIFSVQPYEY